MAIDTEPTQVNIHAAKTQLSKLLARVEAGEEIIIARAGKPVARLAPLEVKRLVRKPGAMKGKIWIQPGYDIDAPDPEIEALFYGGDDIEL